MFAAISVIEPAITDFMSLIVAGIFSGTLYFAIIFMMARAEMIKTVKFIMISVRGKHT
jgi:hypothetical protein